MKIFSTCNADIISAARDYCYNVSIEWNTLMQTLMDYESYDELLEFYEDLQSFLVNFYNQYRRTSIRVKFPEFKPIVMDADSFDIPYYVAFSEKPFEESFPAIMSYVHNHYFRNQDLMIKPDAINESDFFANFFRIIKQKPNTILRSYEKAEATPAYRNKTAEKYNDRIDKIVTKRFNDIYGKKMKIPTNLK